jgi:hypothetical protein
MCFKKLNLNFTPPEFQLGEREMEYGLDIDNEFHGIWYSGIKNDNDFELKEHIPKKYRNQFTVQLMEINYYILPHTDSGVKSVVNFYIETDECLTRFYEVKEGAQPFKINNQTDGCVYRIEDLELGPSFIAKPGDVYILDVSKVHGVIPLTEEKVKRKALCLSSSELNFKQLVEIMS